MGNVLLVEDNLPLRSAVGVYLRRLGFAVWEAGCLAEVQREEVLRSLDVAVVDFQLPDGTALDLLEFMRGSGREVPTVVLTGMASIDLAVRSIKAGAEHFLTKPVDLESLGFLLQRLLESSRARRHGVSSNLRRRCPLDPFIGKSQATAELRDLAHAMLGSEAPVLIQGETGTGKGVLARWLHEHGSRRHEPFVELNCAGLSHDAVSSELFGIGPGAAPGAAAQQTGLLEAAHRGTLFLAGIGELDPGVQPRLLELLEQRTFRRLGDTQPRYCDVRLVSASASNLSAVGRGARFRRDLLYRINTVTLDVPPLRERIEDIPALSRVLLDDLGAQSVDIADDAMASMMRYAWPGNVREMRNVLERAVLFRKGNVLDRSALRFDRNIEPEVEAPFELCTLERAEAQHIAATLTRLGGRVDDAAKILDVSRSTLYAKLKRHGLSVAPSSGTRRVRTSTSRSEALEGPGSEAAESGLVVARRQRS